MANALPADVQPVCVLVHGFTSSSDVWAPMRRLIGQDSSSDELPLFRVFDYSSRAANTSLTEAIPTLDIVADQLRTEIETIPTDRRVILVGHSQGGLVIQRHLDRQWRDDERDALRRIDRVVLFATPNLGSNKLGFVRRLLAHRNPQERSLRPFDENVAETHRRVVRDIVARSDDHPGQTRRIPFIVFLGADDDVVKPASARGSFPKVGVLPGGHTSVVQPDTLESLNYRSFRAAVTTGTSGVDVVTAAEHLDAQPRTPHVDHAAAELPWPLPPRRRTADHPTTDADAVTADAVAADAVAADAVTAGAVTAGAVTADAVTADAVTADAATADAGTADAAASAESLPTPARELTFEQRLRDRQATAEAAESALLTTLSTEPSSRALRELLTGYTRQRTISQRGFRVRLVKHLPDVYVRVRPTEHAVVVRVEERSGRLLVAEELEWRDDVDPVEFVSALFEQAGRYALVPETPDKAQWLQELLASLAAVKAWRTQIASVDDPWGAQEFCGPQWAVYDWGVGCLERPYSIVSSRFAEMDWTKHMEGKTWINLSSFEDALYSGKLLTGADPEQR